MYILVAVLIFYFSARQKEKALSSITEVVQTVKNPRRHSQTDSHDMTPKPIELEKFRLDSPLQKYAEIEYFKTPGRSTSHLDAQSVLSSMPSSPRDPKKPSRKLGRSSLLGSARSSLMG